MRRKRAPVLHGRDFIAGNSWDFFALSNAGKPAVLQALCGVGAKKKARRESAPVFAQECAEHSCVNAFRPYLAITRAISKTLLE